MGRDWTKDWPRRLDKGEKREGIELRGSEILEASALLLPSKYKVSPTAYSFAKGPTGLLLFLYFVERHYICLFRLRGHRD